jgi:hypothetical protein
MGTRWAASRRPDRRTTMSALRRKVPGMLADGDAETIRLFCEE